MCLREFCGSLMTNWPAWLLSAVLSQSPQPCCWLFVRQARAKVLLREIHSDGGRAIRARAHAARARTSRERGLMSSSMSHRGSRMPTLRRSANGIPAPEAQGVK